MNKVTVSQTLLKAQMSAKNRVETTYFVQYRIYLGLTQGTGDGKGHAVKGKMVKDARKIVDRFFEGYTVFNAKGTWKGTQELSKVFEIIATNTSREIVKGIAEEIRDLCRQNCVMITENPVDFYMV